VYSISFKIQPATLSRLLFTTGDDEILNFQCKQAILEVNTLLGNIKAAA
jgi:hypothetical protein